MKLQEGFERIDPHLVVATRSSPSELSKKLMDAFDKSLAGDGTLDEDVLRIPGMAGRKFRLLLNNLVGSLDDARYLEIGCFMGASLCAALRNNKVTALAIDNWSEFGGPANAFYQHIAQFRTPEARLSVVDKDFRSVDYTNSGAYNILYYDGPHHENDQYDGIRLPWAALDDAAIVIVDDWNWPYVRSGTFRALRDVGARFEVALEVRTTLNDSFPVVHSTESDWHNGCLLASVRKDKG